MRVSPNQNPLPQDINLHKQRLNYIPNAQIIHPNANRGPYPISGSVGLPVENQLNNAQRHININSVPQPIPININAQQIPKNLGQQHVLDIPLKQIHLNSHPQQINLNKQASPINQNTQYINNNNFIANQIKGQRFIQGYSKDALIRPEIQVIPPERRVQYVPYYQKYIDYEQQVYYAPVQRVATDYYQIEHITDYVPIQKQQQEMVTQSVQKVNYRLQYVPVQQKIIHISKQNALSLGITNYQSINEDSIGFNTLYQPVDYGVNTNYVQPVNVNVQTASVIGPALKDTESAKEVSRMTTRTNFVTSQNYDVQTHWRQIDRILSRCEVRNHVKQVQVKEF